MSRAARHYIWRKSCGPKWLLQNEARLRELTASSLATIERPGQKRMLLESACQNLAKADRLVEAFGGRREELARDWLARFAQRNASAPLRIGSRLVINDSVQGHARPTLVIPAGAAFGTGDHATTAMTLRLLERATRQFAPGWRMLDAGTGSGILALGGARFGAGEVVAFDHDAQAIATAKGNARANGIRTVKFVVAEAAHGLPGKFDVITANLYSELLILALPGFHRNLARDGRLILSGVLRAQEAGLVRSLQHNGFCLEDTRRRGKWIALTARADGG